MTCADAPQPGRNGACAWCKEKAQTTYDEAPVCLNCAADLKAFEDSREELSSILFQAYAQWVIRWAGHLTFVLSPGDLLAVATGEDGNAFINETVEAFAAAGIAVEYASGLWGIRKDGAA